METLNLIMVQSLDNISFKVTELKKQKFTLQFANRKLEHFKFFFVATLLTNSSILNTFYILFLLFWWLKYHQIARAVGTETFAIIARNIEKSKVAIL